MGNQVEVGVRSELKKLIDDLAAINKASDDMTKSLKTVVEGIGDSTNEQTKKVSGAMKIMSDMGKRVFGQLGKDMKAMVSMNSLLNGFQMNQQFRNTAKETVTLSDAIRKLGGYYGVAASRASDFQSKLTKDLGKYGLGADAGANAIMGLRGTGVKGEESLTEYSKMSGFLASSGAEQGNEGGVAKGMASVIQSRGGDVNNTSEVKQLAQDVQSAMNQSGQSASQILASMNGMYQSMSEENRKMVGGGGMAQMAGIESQVGEGSLAFLKPYLNAQTTGEQAKYKALGYDGLVNKGGVDLKAVRAFGDEARRLGSGNMAVGLGAKGITDEKQVQDFQRLYAMSGTLEKDRQNVPQSKPLEEEFRAKTTMGEAFSGNLSNFASTFSDAFSKATNGLTEVMSSTMQSDVGSAAVSIGGAALSAAQTSIGLQGAASLLGVSAPAGLQTAATASMAGPAGVLAAGGGMLAGEGFKSVANMSGGSFGQMQMEITRAIESAIISGFRMAFGQPQKVIVEQKTKDFKVNAPPRRMSQ